MTLTVPPRRHAEDLQRVEGHGDEDERVEGRACESIMIRLRWVRTAARAAAGSAASLGLPPLHQARWDTLRLKCEVRIAQGDGVPPQHPTIPSLTLNAYAAHGGVIILRSATQRSQATTSAEGDGAGGRGEVIVVSAGVPTGQSASKIGFATVPSAAHHLIPLPSSRLLAGTVSVSISGAVPLLGRGLGARLAVAGRRQARLASHPPPSISAGAKRALVAGSDTAIGVNAVHVVRVRQACPPNSQHPVPVSLVPPEKRSPQEVSQANRWP